MRAGWIAAVGLLVALPASAGAEPRGFSIGARPAWLATGGLTAGGTVATGDRGGYLGGELSVNRVREARFVGIYADAYYDFGADGTYLTCGPELGWIRRSRMFPIGLGVDAGGVLRVAGATDLGATGRVFVSFMGVLALYARYAYLDAEAPEHVVQLGVTLKFPLGSPL